MIRMLGIDGKHLLKIFFFFLSSTQKNIYFMAIPSIIGHSAAVPFPVQVLARAIKSSLIFLSSAILSLISAIFRSALSLTCCALDFGLARNAKRSAISTKVKPKFFARLIKLIRSIISG